MKTIQITIPEYKGQGLRYIWDPGFVIKTEYDNNIGTVLISANQAGLFSLARHLLTLAQPEVPIGFHHHFDENSPLEEGSTSLIIEKM